MLQACPECGSEVSDKAVSCPKCGNVLKKPSRGFFGYVFLILFIGFNVLMVAWLATYWGQIGGALSEGSDAARTGATIGATIGTGLVLGIWAVGDIILGVFVYLTKPRVR